MIGKQIQMKRLLCSRLYMPRFWGVALLNLLCSSIYGQFVYFEDFSGVTAPGWTFNTDGTNPGPRLTAGTSPNASDPETVGPIDVDGNGWLRMATETGNQANSVYLSTAIPSSANEITITFDFAFWGSSSGTGADGLSVFLFDNDITYDGGAEGGSLNYAQKTGNEGLDGGYIGVGLDVWGNYSNQTEGRTGSDPGITLGGTSVNEGFLPNQVVLRGPDDSLAQDGSGNYYYLAGTGGHDYTAAGDNAIQDLVDFNPGNGNLAFPDQEFRTDQDAADYRRFQMTLTDSDQLTLRMEFGQGTGFIELFTADLSDYDRPESLNIGFGAATGGEHQVYEIRNLLVTADGLDNTWYWTDADTGDSRVWSDLDNWNPNSIPGEGANYYGDVVFSSEFVTNAMAMSTVTVDGGTDKVIGSLFFSGAYDYELSAESTERFVFDTDGAGISVINILNNPQGNADHTVNLDLELKNALGIDNLVDQTLTFTGNIDTNGNDITFETVGTTLVTGVISEGADIVAEGDGTVRITGNNTYTGTTTITNGVYQIEHGNALGGTSADTVVTSGGTLALSGDITTVSGESVRISGSGEGGVGALSNGSGNNTWSGAVDLDADATIGAQSGNLNISGAIDGNGNDLIFNPASEASVSVSGVISDSSGTTNLIQDGEGMTTLSGNNNYSGVTTVRDGTLAISNGGALGNTDNGTVVESGGTLEVTGGFTISSAETYTLTGLGDTGKAAFWASSGTTEVDGVVTVTGGSASFGADTGAKLSLDGGIEGTDQDVIITGTGIVEFANPMSYTGDTLIQSGTLLYRDANDRIHDASDIVISSGALYDMNGYSDAVGSIAGAGNIDLGSATLTFGGNDTNTAFSGNLAGSGNLVKTGSGTTVFSGASTVNGDLTISEGTVALGADNVFSDSMDVLLNGGTLSTYGFADTFNNLTLLSSSTIDFNSMAGGELTFADASRSGGTLTINNWAGDLSGNGSTFLQIEDGNIGTLIDNIEITGWGGAELLSLGGGLYEVVPTLDNFAIWDGSKDQDWNDRTNWQDSNGYNIGSDPDSNGAKALIGDIDTGLNGSTILLKTDITVGTLVINNDDTFTISSTSSGHELYFNNNGSQATLTTLGATTLTIDREIRMQDDLLIQNNSSGTLYFTDSDSGFDFRTNGDVLTFDGSGRTVIDSQITESGSLVMRGSGILELNDNNTYSGGSAINGGTVLLGNNNALGSGTITINGGTLAANGANRNLNESYSINGSFTVGNDDGRDLMFSGNGTIASGAQSITVESGIDFTVGGDLTGSGIFVKEGDGTVVFSGDNSTFSGGLIVNDGTAQVNVSTGITLGGTQVNENYLGGGSITVNNGGLLDLDTTQGVRIASGGLFANAGGTATINGGTDFLIDGSFVQSGGTTTVSVVDDIILGSSGELTVSGGNVNLNGGDDFSTGNGGAAIAVSNGGHLTVDLSTEVSASNFDLAANDTIEVNGSGSQLTITPDSNGSVTVDGEVTLSDSGMMVVTAGSTTFSSVSRLDGGTAASKGTLEVRGDLTMAGDTEVINAPNISFVIADGGSAIDAVFDGNAAATSIENMGTITKSGEGVLALGSNLNNIQASEIDIEGGTLLLSTSDQIANNTKMILGGGSWDTDGNDEVLGSLTLAANSNIFLGDGDSVVEFADSSSEVWNGDALVINEWSGSENGGGTDQIYFGTDADGLTAAQLGKVFFVNPNGLTGTYGARILSTGEIVPVVPEPKAYVAGAALLLLVGSHYYRRRKREARLVVEA